MTEKTRRVFVQRLIRLSAAGAAFGLLAGGRIQAAEQRDEIILQPAEPEPGQFMQRAFAMRQLALDRGDQAYGAVIVRDGLIVGQAPSRVVVAGDPSAHAEMETIRDTARRLGSRHLHGCVMYSSSPPCPMCRAAAYWAGIESLVFGAELSDGGRPYLC